MVALDLDSAQLSRVRFAVSPLWEVGLAALVLRRDDPGALFSAWVSETRRRLTPELVERVLALTAGRDFIPDALGPLAGKGHHDIASGLEHLRALPAALLARDLHRLDAAHRGGNAWIRGLVADPSAAPRALAAVVQEFWSAAIAPHWVAFERLARADIARHGLAAAQAGHGAMFDQLHPRLAWTGVRLEIDGACATRYGPSALHNGVVLVPSAFAWPDIHVSSNAPYQPAIAYGARGFAGLWDGEAVAAPALDRLLGPGRARVAQAIATPSTTTELSHALGMAPATVSEHLHTLADSGLANRARDGRTVVYSLSELGRGLLDT